MSTVSEALHELDPDSLEAQKLPGTEKRQGYVWPFWSPDSRFVGFAADGKLKKIDVAGGPAETIVELAGQFGGGAWNREGTVLFASNDHGLQRFSASGGALTSAATTSCSPTRLGRTPRILICDRNGKWSGRQFGSKLSG